MRLAYFVAGLIVGLAVAVFGLQNIGGVEIQFRFWHVQVPLALVVYGAVGAGLLVAVIRGLPEALLARWRFRGLERRLEDRPHEGSEAHRLRDAV